MEASFPTSVPRNDLGLAKTSQDYHDKRIETTAPNNLSGQLWYLSEKLLASAFFDQKEPYERKRQMVSALDKHRDKDPLKSAARNDFSKNSLADFVLKNTRRFFPEMKNRRKVPNGGPWFMEWST